MPLSNIVCNPSYWKTLVQRARFSYDDIPDLTGKVAIVTGANTGLGYATTIALASHGVHVILACRSEAKAMEAIEKAKVDVKKMNPMIKGDPKLEFLSLDLNDMNSCHRAAKQFLEKGLPLHLLVNNGGIMTSPFALSADGIEQQFAVNHMG
ncbi:hypothetical protein BG011_007908, partial [Mortierella polycephala]